MARPLRFLTEGGALVEVTTRTFQSRLLLTPKPLLNRIILGVLARASHPGLKSWTTYGGPWRDPNLRPRRGHRR